MSHTATNPTLYSAPLEKQEFKFTNIITNDTYDIELYPDDTNLTVLNKLCVKLNILTDEICAYVNDYNLIGFSYNNINIKKIFNKNKLDLSHENNYLDGNFVDNIGNMMSVEANNLMNKLFEGNFTSWPMEDNNIYYFTLNDLIEQNPDMNDKFIYSVVYKYFPNIEKDYIDNYPNKYNSDLRKDHVIKIKKLLAGSNYFMDTLDNNGSELIAEQEFTSKLLNFKCINVENNINIIKLFSDYELSSKRFFTKLILEGYNNSFFKLYKPVLDLKLSDDSNILDKDICNKLLNDFSDNVSLPYDFTYIPPSIQPRNCMIFKTYLLLNPDENPKDSKDGIFYSFILFMNGSYDFIINNYDNINIGDNILLEVEKDINSLIKDINRFGVYTINKIPRLKQGDWKRNISFINSTILFQMWNFEDEESGDYVYEKRNLLKYLSNFSTHIRIVKEKMDKDDDPNTIFFKYKRVNNYETIDTIQSIISALHDPNIDIPPEEFIEIISQNLGISIKEATTEHGKWSEANNYEFQRKSLKTSEAGADIIMDKYLDDNIKFTIYNVLSIDELNRIIHFIKVFMKLYREFVEGTLEEKLKIFFQEDIDKGIEDIQEEQQNKQLKDNPLPENISSVQVDDEDLFDGVFSDTTSDLSDSDQSGGGIRKINQGRNSYDFYNNLKNYDDKLFVKNYPGACTNNQGIRMPIPLWDYEVVKLKKYDILKTVIKNKKKLTHREIRDYILKYPTVDNLKEKLENEKKTQGIELDYSEEFPSFLNTISQHKIGSKMENINYICPKYWDIPKRVAIHPRDIYDRLDDIIPFGHKGNTTKSIICNEGLNFKGADDSEIKKKIILFLKYFDFYKFLKEKHRLLPKSISELEKGLRDSMRLINGDKEKKGNKDTFKSELDYLVKNTPDRKIMKDPVVKKRKEDLDKPYKDNTKLFDLDMKSFNDYIIKNIPTEYYDLLHQQIVKYFQPQFQSSARVDGKFVPCCFTYKSTYEVGKPKPVPKLNKSNIRIADLTPSNINKFAHIHLKLQNLFGFENEFYDNRDHLGGFIKFGVQQDNNSLINVLSNFYFKENNEKNFKKNILEKSLTDENSLLTFMKCGDGNIVQLFKSSKYNINDIEYFLNYIDDEKNTTDQLSKINIKNKVYKSIKKYFENYKRDLHAVQGKSDFDRNKYTTRFKGEIYKADININIKFIYDLIISKNNFLKYLNSDEIKDYKYILPLMAEIKKDHIYILFENNDDSINIRLPLNTYDIYNDKSIFNFIYKVGDIYEPIYYFKNIKPMANGNMECDIEKNMHSYGKINEYIGNILDSISAPIIEIYIENNKYFSFDTLIPQLEEGNEATKLLVDSYCKVSHVITKKGYIYPVIPSKIPAKIKSKIVGGFKLIYSFPTRPTFKQFLEYSLQPVIKKKFKIKGFILNDKNNIINIVFKNNTYIPIEDERYDKTNENMRRLPILGYKDLFIIDKDLQNFTQEEDKRYLYNTDNDYLNYITNLTIQNIIYYIKKHFKTDDYYTSHTRYEEDVEYVFELKPKYINSKKVDIIEENTDLIDYFYDENKFKGTVVRVKPGLEVDGTKLSKLKIKKTLLNELYLILNNGIHTNFDKQTNIFKFLTDPQKGGKLSIIDEIIIKLPDGEYEKHKLNNDLAICSENEDDCQYPCSASGKCKLYVKESDIYDKDKSLINKIIYKFIELLLIHKNIDKISSILQDNINLNDLYKTAKNDEVFFNYMQYQNKYIDELFKSESKFIRNINFYDRENTYLNQSQDSKPNKSIIKGIPNIIKKLFPHSNVLTYIDENNLDFQALKYSFDEIYNEEGSTDNIKQTISNELDNHKSKKRLDQILDRYGQDNIDDIKTNLMKPTYKINRFDLELLSISHHVNKSTDIGFLLISSKYSNEKNLSKLKHTILLKYKYKKKESTDKDTKFILLYHFLNEDGEYDLANIVFKNDESDDDGEDQYKSYLSLEKLLEIPMIKTIIENDYPDLI